MASIIGGIGTSHVPTIAMAFDKGKQNDPDWKPLFQGYEAVAKWLAEKKPDVLFFCFNDHATTFFFDHYPTFALGVGEEYKIADEGFGTRPIPRLKGHAPMARHIARSLVADEFDISVFQDLPLDHGLHSPLTMMWPTKPDWPGAVVPLVVNVLQHPLPSPRRCYKLGQAIVCRTMRPVLQTLGIEHFAIERNEDVEFVVGAMARQAYATQAPAAVILSPLLTKKPT